MDHLTGESIMVVPRSVITWRRPLRDEGLQLVEKHVSSSVLWHEESVILSP
jgi:hypothetical protein